MEKTKYLGDLVWNKVWEGLRLSISNEADKYLDSSVRKQIWEKMGITIERQISGQVERQIRIGMKGYMNISKFMAKP